MPDLSPVYRSTQMPTTRPGSPGPASPSMHRSPDVSSGSRAISRAMNETAEIFKNLHAAHERTALNEAKIDALKEISDFKNSLITRTDYQNFEPEYKNFIKELPERYEGKFKNNETWNDFLADFKHQAIITGASISVLTRKQQIDYGRASLRKNQKKLELNFQPSDNKKARQAIFDQYEKLIQDNIASGYLTREEGETEVTAFHQKTDMKQALFELKTKPEKFNASDYKYLNEKTKLQFENQAKRIREAKNKAIKEVRERLIKEANIRIRREIRDDLAMLETTGEGITDLVTEAQETLPEEEFEKYIEKRERARNIFHAWNLIKYQDPRAAAETLQRLKPGKGSGYAEDLQDYRRLVSNYNTAMLELYKDPHAYAMTAPGIDSPEKSLAFQERMGVPEYRQRVMTELEANERVAQINALDPEERIKTIEEMAMAYGKYWNMAYRQMVEKGLPAETQIMTSVIDQPAVLRDVANAAAAGKNELKAALTDPGKEKFIENSVKEILTNYEETIRRTGMTVKTINMLNDIREIIINTAMYRAAKGMDPGKAAKETADEIILNKYHGIESEGYFAGPLKYTRIPADIDIETVEKKAERILNYLNENNVDLPDEWPVTLKTDSTNPKTLNMKTNKSQKKAYIRKIKDEAYWATMPDDSGLILMMNNTPVINRIGEPISFQFSQKEDLE